MRTAPHPDLDKYRTTIPGLRLKAEGNEGVFLIPACNGKDTLKVISSVDGGGDDKLDHVSVSLTDRTPTWEEMCQVKDLFFDDEEGVVQLHPPKSHYVDVAKHCLHMWRRHDRKLFMPTAEAFARGD